MTMLKLSHLTVLSLQFADLYYRVLNQENVSHTVSVVVGLSITRKSLYRQGRLNEGATKRSWQDTEYAVPDHCSKDTEYPSPDHYSNAPPSPTLSPTADFTRSLESGVESRPNKRARLDSSSESLNDALGEMLEGVTSESLVEEELLVLGSNEATNETNPGRICITNDSFEQAFDFNDLESDLIRPASPRPASSHQRAPVARANAPVAQKSPFTFKPTPLAEPVALPTSDIIISNDESGTYTQPTVPRTGEHISVSLSRSVRAPDSRIARENILIQRAIDEVRQKKESGAIRSRACPQMYNLKYALNLDDPLFGLYGEVANVYNELVRTENLKYSPKHELRLKSAKQVRARWVEHLDPDLTRGSLSTQEMRVLLDYYFRSEIFLSEQLKWAEIRDHLYSVLGIKRAANDIKNKFNALKSKLHALEQKSSELKRCLPRRSSILEDELVAVAPALGRSGYAGNILSARDLCKDEEVRQLAVEIIIAKTLTETYESVQKRIEGLKGTELSQSSCAAAGFDNVPVTQTISSPLQQMQESTVGSSEQKKTYDVDNTIRNGMELFNYLANAQLSYKHDDPRSTEDRHVMAAAIEEFDAATAFDNEQGAGSVEYDIEGRVHAYEGDKEVSGSTSIV